MKGKSKFLSVSTLVRGLVIGSILVSRAAASVLPVWSGGSPDVGVKWAAVRDEVQNAARRQTINADIIDLLHGADLDRSLDDAVRMSYAIATNAEIKALDELWVDTIMLRGDSRLMAQYLAMRATLELGPDGDSRAYVDEWLWLANGGGNCDGGNGNNGWGNGDQDAPGGSEDNNNAENGPDGNP